MSEVMGERVPEGGGGDGEGSVPPGSVLGSGGRGEEVGISRSEVAGGGVMVKEVSEVGGGEVVEGLVSDEE